MMTTTTKPAAPLSSPPLRLMTYNIRLGIQLGLEPLARIINAEAPDLLALQEVGDRWRMGPDGDTTGELAQRCGFLCHHHVAAIVEGEHRYGHALLSRHPMEVLEVVALPRSEDEPRALLHARVETPAGVIDVLSTHLSWIGDRPAQGEVLADRALELIAEGRALCVLGDLNEHDGEVTWLKRLKGAMRDADEELGRATFPASEPRLKIDYILVSRGRCDEARVLDEPRASDHAPLVARWRP